MTINIRLSYYTKYDIRLWITKIIICVFTLLLFLYPPAVPLVRNGRGIINFGGMYCIVFIVLFADDFYRYIKKRIQPTEEKIIEPIFMSDDCIDGIDKKTLLDFLVVQ